MPDELKPCPFCGGEPDVYTYRLEPSRENPTKVVCKMCGVETPTYFRYKNAIDAWQRRAGEAPHKNTTTP